MDESVIISNTPVKEWPRVFQREQYAMPQRLHVIEVKDQSSKSLNSLIWKYFLAH
jgi:hypothetical protein